MTHDRDFLIATDGRSTDCHYVVWPQSSLLFFASFGLFILVGGPIVVLICFSFDASIVVLFPCLFLILNKDWESNCGNSSLTENHSFLSEFFGSSSIVSWFCDIVVGALWLGPTGDKQETNLY